LRRVCTLLNDRSVPFIEGFALLNNQSIAVFKGRLSLFSMAGWYRSIWEYLFLDETGH
jgi:hypothetical protein